MSTLCPSIISLIIKRLKAFICLSFIYLIEIKRLSTFICLYIISSIVKRLRILTRTFIKTYIKKYKKYSGSTYQPQGWPFRHHIPPASIVYPWVCLLGVGVQGGLIHCFRPGIRIRSGTHGTPNHGISLNVG
jgi:hypothetical protein